MPYGQAKSCNVLARPMGRGRGFNPKLPSPDRVRQVRRQSFLVPEMPDPTRYRAAKRELPQVLKNAAFIDDVVARLMRRIGSLKA